MIRFALGRASRRIGFAAVTFGTLVAMCGAHASEDSRVAAGRAIAHDVYKGNCLACHQIPQDASAVTMATIGPPLVGLKERYPNRAVLREHIWDATARNPHTVMPPFGKHRVLSEREIDLVVDYLYRY